MLDRAGIGDFLNPSLFVYTGGDDATTLAVQNGAVDVGGVEKRIMRSWASSAALCAPVSSTRRRSSPARRTSRRAWSDAP